MRVENKHKNQYFCSFLARIGKNTEKSEFEEILNYLPRYNIHGRLYETSGVTIIVFPPENNPLHKFYVVFSGNKLFFLQGEFYDNVPHESIPKLLNSNELNNDSLSLFINELNGVFNGFLADLNKNNCTAFMNQFGFNFLYYSIDKSCTWLSSSIWPLLRINTNKNTLNIESLQEYILYGYPTGNKTLFSNIFTVQPRKLDFITPSGVSTSSYSLPNIRQDISTKSALNNFESACCEHFGYIKKHFSNDQFVTTLTGGHDTRVVLNAMLKNDIHPACLTGSGWPKKVTADAKRAKYTARLAGCNWNMIDYTILSHHNRSDMFFLSEAGESGAWMGNIGIEAKTYGDITYYGFSGDILSGDCGINNIHSLYNIDTIAHETFFHNYEYEASPQTLIPTLFGVSFKDILARYVDTFAEYKELDPYSIYLLQRIGNRNFRRIGNFASTSRLGSVAVSLFHDKRIAQIYLELPLRLLKHQKLQCMLGYSARPLLACIPANGWYVPLGAEPLILSGTRRLGKSVLSWVKPAHIINKSQNSAYLNSRIQKTLDYCKGSGFFDIDAIRSIIKTERTGSILLLIKRFEVAEKMIQFSKGNRIEEEEHVTLFSSDFSKVKRFRL